VLITLLHDRAAYFWIHADNLASLRRSVSFTLFLCPLSFPSPFHACAIFTTLKLTTPLRNVYDS
jgi:hypothetical protein